MNQPITSKLGELLVQQSACTAETIQSALAQQQRCGGRLGEIMTSTKRINLWQLYSALAAQKKRPLVNLIAHPSDKELLNKEHKMLYWQRGFIPWRRLDEYLIIACTHPSKELKRWAAEFYHCPVQLVYCTPRDLRTTIEDSFGALIEHEVRYALYRSNPLLSAAKTTIPLQRRAMVGISALLAALMILAPSTTALALFLAVNALYVMTIFFKYWLHLTPAPPPDEQDIATVGISDHQLPIYSILVPMYREADAVCHLIESMRSLDYPRHKLDIKLVVEADDDETIRAIMACKPESCFDIIRVPPSNPRTKPKACCYALQFVKGEFVTIYDTEDRPQPDQLRKAVAAFRAAPQDVACFQARLNFYNWNENWLTRFFALEYSALFDKFLPALQQRGIPIPLGGTSNHMRTHILKELLAWDPFNVTEDADLGIRLAINGYQTRMLASVTLEEAPIHFTAWLKQRTRWIKGYMQTWLVYIRQPALLNERLSPVGRIGFHLFIGAPTLVFLLAPLFWLVSILGFSHAIDLSIPYPLVQLSVAVFIMGAFCHIHLAISAVNRWRWPHMELSALAYAFYWFLHSLASIRALWQLLTRPHYWDKTTHNQTRYSMRDIKASLRMMWQKSQATY